MAHVSPSGIILKCPYDRTVITSIQELDGTWKKEGQLWVMPLSMDAMEFILNENFDVDDMSMHHMETFIKERMIFAENSEQRRAWSRAYYAEPIPEVQKILRSDLLTPAPFQWVPSYYARLTDANFLLSDPMGCVDGDAIVNVNRAGRGFKIKLSKLFDRFNDNKIDRYSWDTSIPTYIRSLCDGVYRLNKIKQVVKKGLKQTLLITLASGKSIAVTPDHEMSIDLKGVEFVAAGELKVGDNLVTNGPKFDTIVSIENGGYREVYDVVCADPYRNFVANQIVVHNSGKSIESTLVTLLPEYQKYNVLIVCPANAVYNWQDELMGKFGFKSYVITKPLPYLLPSIRYYIVSFQMIQKAQFNDPMFLIVDESAEIKNVKAKRTQNVAARALSCPHKMLMSGTPTPNRPEEAFSQIKILDPNFMPYEKFTKTFCNSRYSPHKFGKDTSGHSNLDKLHDLLFDNYIVMRSKEQILPQLPKKLNHVIHLSDKAIEGESLMEMYANNALAKAEDSDFWEWVHHAIDCSEGDKILWFYHHKSLGEAFCKYFEKNGMDYYFIDGSTEKEDRQKQVREFQTPGNKTQHFVLSLMAASTALTLTSSHITIHAELVFSPGVHAQASDRTHRIGQKYECQNYYLLFSRLEKRIWDIHVEKMSVLDQIYSGTMLDADGTDDSIKARIAKEFNVPIIKKKEKKVSALA